MLKKLPLLFLLCSLASFAQDLSLYNQFNGHYDYTAIGNTMNLAENETATFCDIQTQTSANLSLNANQNVIAAYLYWAGSGPGDFDVSLNAQPVQAQRNFLFNLSTSFSYFAAFADVTSIVQTNGNGLYTFADFDLTQVIDDGYCNAGINFGGWAIIIIYEDASLPLNQVNIYDGFEIVYAGDNTVNIDLNNLNVVDDQGAKIGFLAWEGDSALNINEELSINGNVLSNAINPPDNAFNGTNTFTNQTDFYNMDLDLYDIEGFITPGDSSAQIQLTSGDGTSVSDIVAVNNIVTVLNSELPNPSPSIDAVDISCNSRSIEVDYTIYNTNATDALPANTLVSFFANNTLLGQTNTLNDIPIDGTESGQITLQIPSGIPPNFNLNMSVNIDANGDQIITEVDPSNNFDAQQTQLIEVSIANPPQDITQCDDLSNDGSASYDLTQNSSVVMGNQQDVEVAYFNDPDDAENNTDAIQNPQNYTSSSLPEIIYIRVSSAFDEDCFVTDSFMIDLFYTPVANSIADISLCNENPDGENAQLDLTSLETTIVGNQSIGELSFHTTPNDAENGSNPIANPSTYQNEANPQPIYIRLQNPNHPECYTTTDFTLTIQAIDRQQIEGLTNCDEGFDLAYFDLQEVEANLSLAASEEIMGYYTSLVQAYTDEDPITNPGNFKSQSSPQRLYISIDNPTDEACFRIVSFEIDAENCPPDIPQAFSPNNDGVNDSFEIKGLYDIFEDFNLKIYSRLGNLVYEANNDIPAWDGTSNRGLGNQGKELPTGTYYYVLNLNDAQYPIFKSWVYLQR